MSIRTVHDVTCDICAEHAGIEAESVTEARRIAQSEDGWINRPASTSDGKAQFAADVCPECQENGGRTMQ